MRWADLRGSEVRDPAVGRGCGRMYGRQFCIQGLRCLWKDDTERDDSLFSWTGSDKYSPAAAGISSPSAGVLWYLKKMLVGFSGSLVNDGHSEYGSFTFIIRDCAKTIQKATLQN